MKPGVKATAILMATLVLGIVLGFVGHGTWEHYRNDRPDRRPGPGGFIERMERILQPDSLNADTIHAVLVLHQARFLDVNKEQRAAMQAMMDSLITDLRGLVPEDRIERLEQIRERGLAGRGKRGPGRRRR